MGRNVVIAAFMSIIPPDGGTDLHNSFVNLVVLRGCEREREN